MIRLARIHHPGAKIRFWRDPDGPEVDWVVEHEGLFVPIEVKLTSHPTSADARHLKVFQAEYGSSRGYVVSTVTRPVLIEKSIKAVPWKELPRLIEKLDSF